MTDEEWNRWAATYAREQRPLPPVLARARTDRGRAILGMAVVYALGAALAVSAARGLLQAPRTWLSAASHLFELALVLAIVAGAQIAMRGAFRHGAGAPLDLLADLERRHAGRRRLLRFLPWIVAIAVVGTLATTAAEMVAAGRFDPAAAAGTLAVCAATAALAWVIIRRIGRLIDRELRAAAEARRLLSEPDDDTGSP